MKPRGTSEYDDGMLVHLEVIIGTVGLNMLIEAVLSEVDRLAENTGRWPYCGS
jgi:structural maintenance of chromosome 4